MGVGSETLWVSSFSAAITGWTEVGTTPYLSTENYPTDYIWAYISPSSEYAFFFQSTENTQSIESVMMWIRCRQLCDKNDYVTGMLYIGASGYDLPKVYLSSDWNWSAMNVSDILDTWGKIGSVNVRLSSGVMSDEFVTDLNADNYTEINKEWTVNGVGTNWLETYNDNKYIYTSLKDALMEYFVFEDLPDAGGILRSVKLRIVSLQTGGVDDEIKIEIWDGSSWTTIASNIVPTVTYTTKERDVSSILDTVTKINGARMRLTKITVGGAQAIYVDRAYLRVTRRNVIEVDAMYLQVNYYEDVSIETKDPTACSGNWTNPTNAYVSEETQLYATEETDNEEEIYSTYGFDAASTGSIIHKVYIRPKHYEDDSDHVIDVYVSWDAEFSWSAIARISSGLSESDKELEYLDITDKTDWTPIKLSDDNFRTKVRFVITTGGACFDPTTLVFTSLRTAKRLEDIRVGDKILTWKNNKFDETNVSVYTVHEFDGDGKSVVKLDFDFEVKRDGSTIIGKSNLILAPEHMVCMNPTNQQLRYVSSIEIGETFYIVFNINNKTYKGKITITSKSEVKRNKLINIQTRVPFFFANGVLVHNILKQEY